MKNATPARSKWAFNIRPHTLASGHTAFRIQWWEHEAGKPRRHVCRQFSSRACLDAFISEETARRAHAAQVAKREETLIRAAQRRGDAAVDLLNIPPASRAAVVAALEVIRAAGGTPDLLLPAAKEYARNHLSGALYKVQDAIDAHLTQKQAKLDAGDLAAKTFAERRQYLTDFSKEYGDALLSSVRVEDVEAFISSHPSRYVRAARRRAISACFNYALKKGWIEQNPVERADGGEPVEKKDAVEILTPSQAAFLLDTVQKTAPKMIPYFAIALFAGLRPQGELGKLTWENIDLDGKRIVVRRATSKTHKERPVPISPNLAAFLALTPEEERRGLVAYSRHTARRVILTAAADWKRATGKEWTWAQDIMRHTRQTYRLEVTKNAALVAEEGGHSVSVLGEHYVNRILPKGDADAFWAIYPRA